MAEISDPRAEQDEECGGTAWLAFVFTGLLIGFVGVFTFNERGNTAAVSPVQTASFETAR